MTRIGKSGWRILCVVAAAVLLPTMFAVAPASAHGAVSDPLARHWGCYQRWPNGATTQTATEDPMCYRAWQANPGAMWNWNGLLRDGVGGNHQAAVPDGQLCSGGLTFDGSYAAFDEPGPWKTVDRPTRFTLNLYDQSSHGADYIRVYVTKQGFDPATQRPRWGDLELAGQATDVRTGTTTPVEVNAPGRTGPHIVYTVWQAGHGDQSYYFCSDVNFIGGATTPSPTPTATGTPTPSPTPTAIPGGGCSATYRVVSQWSGGYQAEVRVTAAASLISSWAVTWTSSQQISNSWGASLTANAGTITARNAGYNGTLGAGTGTTFGFIASGTSPTPALTCTAT